MENTCATGDRTVEYRHQNFNFRQSAALYTAKIFWS